MKPSISNTSSSYYQFQQSLDQYIYFSPLTTGGSSGRAVKIHKDLFLPFFCIVDPTTHDGQSIIRQIENLRTTCTIVRKETGSGYANNPRESTRHKSQLAKVNSAFHQVLIIKNLHVHYRVSQEAGDKAPSIYISHIRQVSRDTGSAPGLYENAKGAFGSNKGPQKSSLTNVDGKKIYINGSSETLKNAMDHARYATDDNNALLFYCPALAVDELGPLGRNDKSRVTTSTIDELRNVLANNQKASRGVSWYVDGRSASVLTEAVKQVTGDLSMHSFRLINPVANTAHLIDSLAQKKAKFEGEFFKYDQNRVALITLGAQKDDVLRAIGKLPAAKNYDIITRKNIVKAIEGLSRFGENATAAQSKLSSPNQTFVQLLKTAGGFRK